jgi:hypothetical protein
MLFGASNDAITALQDIRRLHQLQAWLVLPDRYTSLKRNLIAIRSRTPKFYRSPALQPSSRDSTAFEYRRPSVENVIGGLGPPEVPRMDQIIARQLDRLAAIWVELRGGIKGNKE